MMPDAVQISLAGRLDEASRLHYFGLHPISRFGRPDEIAHAALFLANDSSIFVTGAEPVVDGGFTGL